MREAFQAAANFVEEQLALAANEFSAQVEAAAADGNTEGLEDLNLAELGLDGLDLDGLSDDLASGDITAEDIAKITDQ